MNAAVSQLSNGVLLVIGVGMMIADALTLRLQFLGTETTPGWRTCAPTLRTASRWSPSTWRAPGSSSAGTVAQVRTPSSRLSRKYTNLQTSQQMNQAASQRACPRTCPIHARSRALTQLVSPLSRGFMFVRTDLGVPPCVAWRRSSSNDLLRLFRCLCVYLDHRNLFSPPGLVCVTVALLSPRNLRVSDEWYTRFRVAWDPVSAPVEGYRLSYSPAGES